MSLKSYIQRISWSNNFSGLVDDDVVELHGSVIGVILVNGTMVDFHGDLVFKTFSTVDAVAAVTWGFANSLRKSKFGILSGTEFNWISIQTMYLYARNLQHIKHQRFTVAVLS